MYQKDKSSDSKIKFRQARNHCKRVLEAAKLAYANKTEEFILPRNLSLGSSGELLIVFLTKVNMLFLLYSVAQRCSLLHLTKLKLFFENFSKNSNLDDSGISLPVFSSRTNLKLHNISPKMVKKVIMNLDLSEASGPDFIPSLCPEKTVCILQFIRPAKFTHAM